MATSRIDIPQSARPVRTAWAMSGPAGQIGAIIDSADTSSPSRLNKNSSSNCAPAPEGRTATRTFLRARSRTLCNPGEFPCAKTIPCSRRAKAMSMASQARQTLHHGDVFVATGVHGMQMNGRRNHLAIDETLQAGRTSFRKRRKTRRAFAQRPFQQRVVATADNRNGSAQHCSAPLREAPT